VLAGIGGAALIVLLLSEFFVAFMLPRRVRRDPRIARRLIGLLWSPWRAFSRRFAAATADTMLGLFGPLALLFELFVWVIGLMIGYGLLEWAVAGGSFGDRVLLSSGLFLSAGSTGGSRSRGSPSAAWCSSPCSAACACPPEASRASR